MRCLEWHHWFTGHELGQTLGEDESQGSLVCCSPWGRKESDTTKRLNWTTTQFTSQLSSVVNCSKNSRNPDIYMKCPMFQCWHWNSKIFKSLCEPAPPEPNQTCLQACCSPPGCQFTNSKVGRTSRRTKKHQAGHSELRIKTSWREEQEIIEMETKRKCG